MQSLHHYLQNIILMNQLQWHGENDVLTIGPFTIKGPLVYSTSDSNATDGSAIYLPKRFRMPERDASGNFGPANRYQFVYGYRSLDATTRWHYLNWLANGRPKVGSHPFLELYLKGLERRVIADEADALLIWNELWRLYPAPVSEWDYTPQHFQDLLWFLLPQIGIQATHKQVAALARNSGQISQWDPEPRSQLSMLVHWGLEKFGHLPAWLAFYCARILSEANRSVVLERAEWEMVQLFAVEWHRRGGPEMPLSLPERALCRYEYRPLNKTLRTVSTTWKDPLRSSKQWKKVGQELTALFNHCQSELRPFALALGKDGITRESRLAWEALPAPLQHGEHPSHQKIWKLGGQQLEETGYATTTLEEVAKALGMGERPALSPLLSRGLAQSLQYCELGVEPDARLSGKSYRWGDTLVLFSASRQKLGTPDEVAAMRYQSHAGFIRCALYVARAAGEVRQETLTLIAQRLFETFDLQPMEKRRAKALANHLVRQEIVLTGHKWPELNMERLRRQLPPLLFEIVGLNGQINKAEEAALAAVWKRLGLEKRQLTRELDSLSARGVVFVGSKVASRAGEKLPPPPLGGASPTVAFELDHAVIGELLEDTAHVHRALSEAMAVEEEEVGSLNAECRNEGLNESEEVEEEPQAAQPEDTRFPGLAPALKGLLADLLEQPQWELSQAQELARRHDTMLAGAIEKINDWAFEELGEQLIWDDGDLLSVEREILSMSYEN